MFIEVVGSLRCVHEHELSWLVASAYRMEDRHVVSGELGCHVCGARYPVEDGVADFRELGSASCRLWVLEDNSRARRFYERRGWRENGDTRVVEFPPNPLDLGYSLDL